MISSEHIFLEFKPKQYNFPESALPGGFFFLPRYDT